MNSHVTIKTNLLLYISLIVSPPLLIYGLFGFCYTAASAVHFYFVNTTISIVMFAWCKILLQKRII